MKVPQGRRTDTVCRDYRSINTPTSHEHGAIPSPFTPYTLRLDFPCQIRAYRQNAANLERETRFPLSSFIVSPLSFSRRWGVIAGGLTLSTSTCHEQRVYPLSFCPYPYLGAKPGHGSLPSFSVRRLFQRAALFRVLDRPNTSRTYTSPLISSLNTTRLIA